MRASRLVRTRPRRDHLGRKQRGVQPDGHAALEQVGQLADALRAEQAAEQRRIDDGLQVLLCLANRVPVGEADVFPLRYEIDYVKVYEFGSGQ